MTTEGEGGQQRRIGLDDGHAPTPPAHTPNDFVNSIKDLDINARDELMDRLMDVDEPGFRTCLKRQLNYKR